MNAFISVVWELGSAHSTDTLNKKNLKDHLIPFSDTEMGESVNTSFLWDFNF